jgi:putative ABC transport system permease protein
VSRSSSEDSRPPYLAEMVLRIMMRDAKALEGLLGDLFEEYQHVAAARKWRARTWYWQKIFQLCSMYGMELLRAPGRRSRGKISANQNRSDGTRDSLMSVVLQDLSYAIRVLKRQPGFALIVVLTLGLGIGANTAIFSVLNGVLLRPLPFADPARLVVAWETYRPREIWQGAVSYPNLQEWQERTSVFESLAGFHPEPHTVTGMGLPERISAARATHGLFPLLGVVPQFGRTFLPEDDLEGAANVAIVSYSFWSDHFPSETFSGEQSITIDNKPFTIVGVLPEEFKLPLLVADAEVWTPAALDWLSFYHREWPRLIVLGRLAPNVTVEMAQAEMEQVAIQLETDFPETNTEHGANVVALRKQVAADSDQLLWLLLGAVGLVLLIACVNVTNLLLARGADRTHEMVVRSALGASRSRMVRQILTESTLLGLGGGVLGILLVFATIRWLVALIPPGIPRLDEVGVDWRVLGFALLASLLTSLLVGMVPALRDARHGLHASLSHAHRSTAGSGRQRLRRILVTTEVAMALVLLVGGGLLARSFSAMLNVDPGFNPENVLTFRMTTGWSDMEVDQRAAFYNAVVDRVAAIPGVETVGAGTAMPLSGGFRATFAWDDRPEPERGEAPLVRYFSITPTYFEVLKIPLLRGREFNNLDMRDAPGVVIVNETAANRYWPGDDAIGKRIRPDVDITDADPDIFEIVGVVADVKDARLDVAAEPTIYVPCMQQTWPTMGFAIRTTGDATALTGQVRTLLGEMTQEATFQFATLDQTLDRSMVERRFPTVLLALFAVLALALAAVGIYGMLAYSVVQRTHEIGVRMALGARARSVFVLVLKEGLVFVLVGMVCGLCVAFAATRLLSSILFNVTPTDPVTFAGMSLLLLVAALFACLLPTRRATRVDPLIALRAE